MALCRKWNFLHKDCAELAHYFDEKYQDKLI